KAFNDPFSKESGTGTCSSFVLGKKDEFKWEDQNFSVPHINDVVMYEMMVDDFAVNFEGVIKKLEYLKSLGVNCIELMPVTNIPEPYRWGYMPLNYFAIEERFGGVKELKNFVNECHKQDIAVIHDAVYSHMHNDFCYKKVYWECGEENPMIGPFAEDMFGVGTDFNKPFTFDFFLAVNKYFIEELHFDGFRYDYVPGIYDGPMGKGYSKLVYETYQHCKSIKRFNGSDDCRVIQAAEFLANPKNILEETYTTASKRWAPMSISQDMISHYGSVPRSFIDEMLLIDFDHPWPQHYTNGNDSFDVAPIQFIECHDKSRLNYIQSGEMETKDAGFDLFNRDLSKWYRLQPFAIALMTGEGIPLIWQGQEFGEIYGKHDEGGARVLAPRRLHWNYFYEENGRNLVNLYRKLGQLRKKYPALRSRSSYFYFDKSDLNHGVVAYLRKATNGAGDKNVLVLINFNEYEHQINLAPGNGTWEEQLVSTQDKIKITGNQEWKFTIPSNYGKIYVQK
ncbi:MAG: alpha-amylase family glycosyl hydrolase, partial [Desulfobacterales bacterium]|nr:alpha-amylase family glycosyl hydrolase [Desulfobacterales bacterium]